MPEERSKVPYLELAPSPFATVSRDPEGMERIVATSARTSLLRSREVAASESSGSLDDEAHRWLGTVPRQVPQLRWPADARQLVEGRAWATAGELASALASAQGHIYVVFWNRPALVFESARFLPTFIQSERVVTPVLFHGASIVIGPLFDGSICSRCWAERLRANVPTLAKRADRDHSLMLDVREVERWMDTVRLLWEVPISEHPPTWALTIDRSSGRTMRSPVRPGTSCSCSLGLTTQPLDEMADPFFGTAVAIGRANASRRFHIYTARSRLYDDCDGGACSMSAVSARSRAMAECIERISARHPSVRSRVPSDDPRCTTARLALAHPFTREQYEEPGFPYQFVEDPSRIAWVEGERWPSTERDVVPLACVSLAALPSEPPFARRSSTGIAAHVSRALAAEGAILELVERDVATRCWFEGQICLLDVEEFAPVELRALEAEGLEVTLGLCLSDVMVPVLVASLADRATGQGAFGTCARLSLAAAASHALEDAMLMYTHRGPHGLLPVQRLWSACCAAPSKELPWFGDMMAALAHYRPIVVDLTHAEAEAAGLQVVAAWSDQAVDFPAPGQPLAWARWRPSPKAQQRLRETPGVFRVGHSRIPVGDLP